MRNLFTLQGRLAVGSDADIVVWDPHAVKILSAKTHSSASDFNIFEGTNVRGVPVVVIAGGKVAVDQNGTYAQRGWGKYIACHPDSTYVYGRVAARDEVILHLYIVTEVSFLHSYNLKLTVRHDMLLKARSECCGSSLSCCEQLNGIAFVYFNI